MDTLFSIVFFISLLTTIVFAILTFFTNYKKRRTNRDISLVSLLVLAISFIGYQFTAPDTPDSFNETVKITSKKSDTGGFDTDSNGDFTLKGKALYDTKLSIKDDLDDAYHPINKELKNGKNFKIKFHLNKKTDALRLTIHAKADDEKYKKNIEIWNNSNAYDEYIDEQASKDKETEAKAKKEQENKNNSANKETPKENTPEINKISKSVKSSSSYLSGATIQNDILTFVIKNDAAYSGVAGMKFQQKNLLREIESTIQKYRNNDLARNGLLFTGAYYKDDDGTKESAMTFYFDNATLNSLPDFSLKSADYSKEYKDPTRLLDYATNYYIDGMFLKFAAKSKGIYEGIRTNKNDDDTPEWMFEIQTGETVVKPVK